MPLSKCNRCKRFQEGVRHFVCMDSQKNGEACELSFCPRCMDAEFNTPGGNIAKVGEFWVYSLNRLSGEGFEIFRNGEAVYIQGPNGHYWYADPDEILPQLPEDIRSLVRK